MRSRCWQKTKQPELALYLAAMGLVRRSGLLSAAKIASLPERPSPKALSAGLGEPAFSHRYAVAVSRVKQVRI